SAPGPDPLRQLDGARQAGLRQRDRELLAPVARRLVNTARLLTQHPAHHAQHVVPPQVAVGVVDLLEIVDVEDEEREVMTKSMRPLVLLGHELAEAAL